MTKQVRCLKPQDGFQTQFLSSPADIVIGGSGAGVGKTFALLMECLRYSHVPNFGAVVFRRTTPMIANKGGLWDESFDMYMDLATPPTPVPGKHLYRFPNNVTIQFKHMEHIKDRLSYQGAQIPLIGWDELTHFEWEQFSYLLSRGRSTCGVKPYVRATTNPQSSGWVKEFIQWWIYPDDYHAEGLQGYPIPERAGVIRYMTMDKNEIVWADSPEEVREKCPHIFDNEELVKSVEENGGTMDDLIKSVTFIPGSIHDNKKLLSKDPAYLGSLLALDEQEKAKLLGGCWKMIDGADILFKYSSLSDLFNNDFIKESKQRSERYITADIALEGADKFVIGIWSGFVLLKVISIPKCKPDEVIDILKELSKKHGVPRSNIIYDDDGVGTFVKGWLKTAVPFKGGSKALNDENYENLRTQCYYKLAKTVNSHDIYILDTRYEKQIKEELTATRKIPYEGKGKLQIIKKSQIKVLLKRSPDFADMLMMRMLPTLTKRKKGKSKGTSI